MYAHPTWRLDSEPTEPALDSVIRQISTVEAREPPIHPYAAIEDVKERVDELDGLLGAESGAYGDVLRFHAEEAIIAMYRFLRSVSGN
jgi:hypothetical protein